MLVESSRSRRQFGDSGTYSLMDGIAWQTSKRRNWMKGKKKKRKPWDLRPKPEPVYVLPKVEQQRGGR